MGYLCWCFNNQLQGVLICTDVLPDLCVIPQPEMSHPELHHKNWKHLVKANLRNPKWMRVHVSELSIHLENGGD